jgi:hypothetical protein
MRSVIVGCFALLLMMPAAAQTPDPAFASAKATFEALPLAVRREIQRDLVWAGGFNGAASGEFGALTFAAIRRFETATRGSVNGVLEAPERAALAKAANGARAEHGFKLEVDKASGMRIGVPGRLLTKRATNADGLSRWQDAQEKVTLDLQAPKPGDTLEALFAKGTDAAVTTRKITYKLLRPEFFVISGETAGGRFFRRMEKGAGGKLHGFAIGYDKAMAIDPLVIAIASTFEAFPGTAPPPVAASTGTTLAPRTPIAAAPRRARISGVVVGDGRVITAASAAKACKTITLDSPALTMASVQKADAATNLALLSVATARAKPVTLAFTLPKTGLLIQRDLDGKLLAAPVEITGALALAPLQEGGAGAPVFDATGALAGVIVSPPVAKYAIAGTMPVLRHTLVAAKDLAAFAELPAPVAGERPARSSGEIAGDAGGGVVSFFCD